MKTLTEHCHAYKGADMKRSVIQLVTTLGLLFTGLVILFAAIQLKAYWLYALLILPTTGMLIKLFIIQHDCGHGSFFPSRSANDMTGRFISALTFTPYSLWKKAHNMHHASSGHLSRRGAGGIDTLTVKEYNDLPPLKRLLYRLYRNPILLLIVGPPIYLLFLQRFPPIQSLPFLKEYYPVPISQAWRSVVLLDFFLVVVYGGLAALLGWETVFLVYFPVLLATCWVGQWLFFVQHQFEDSYWAEGEDWSFSEAAFHGSSYYVLPGVLQWFTGNIGFHHIHHLCPSIPNYRLQECCEGNKTLSEAGRMTFLESLKCVRFSLWDEELAKMIRFCDLRKIKTA